MIIYHGSYAPIEKPDIAHSRKNVDFGPGFYTTPIYEQARKWSDKFKSRGKYAVVSSYCLNDDVLTENFNVLRFESYSEEWLDFILTCRSGKDCSDYDVVIGGVANDKVFNTVELYFDGLIEKSEAIKRLTYEKPNLQICFRTQRAIDECLKYEGSERV